MVAKCLAAASSFSTAFWLLGRVEARTPPRLQSTPTSSSPRPFGCGRIEHPWEAAARIVPEVLHGLLAVAELKPGPLPAVLGFDYVLHGLLAVGPGESLSVPLPRAGRLCSPRPFGCGRIEATVAASRRVVMASSPRPFGCGRIEATPGPGWRRPSATFSTAFWLWPN